MAQLGALMIDQEREEVYAATAVCSWLSLLGGGVMPKEKMDLTRPKMKAKTYCAEWCLAVSKYRCMRCRESSKHWKIQGQMAARKRLTQAEKLEILPARAFVLVHTTVPTVDPVVFENDRAAT